MKKLTPWLVVMVIFVMTLLVANVAMACPMCKDSIGSGDAEQAGAVSVGFNHSIYVFLTGFLFSVAMVARNIIKAVRSTPVALPSEGSSTGPQSSRGFEVQPSDSSRDGTE